VVTEPVDEGEDDREEAKGDGDAKVEAAPPPEKDPLEEAKAELNKLRDQLLRTAADFDNYRKRSRRDVDDAQKKGAEDLLRTLLPVFDNLERAVLHAEQAADAKAIAEGVRMVLKQFGDTLGRTGIQRVAGVGEPFDPMVHEAVQQVESTDVKPGTVIAEVQPGYRMGERLIRAAMVVVAKAPQTTSKPPPEAN
jgi:molecular chaperone GrpE